MGALALPEAALAYAEAGVPIFPLASKSKRPIYMGGFNQATTDKAQVGQWWTDNPNANIGAVPGKVGCIVPDIDSTAAREAWFSRVVVETATTQTGGGVGVHPWYFSTGLAGRSHWRLDEHGGPFQDDRLANLLFRASGGYVVVAPSIHPDTDQPYILLDPGTPISALPSDIEKSLLTIPSRDAGGGHAVTPEIVKQWLEDVSKPETSPGGRTVLNQRLEAIASAPKDVRNDTLLAEVGVLLNAAYVWPINLEEAREEVRAIYVPHVADTRRARDANREVDHAFDYVATQRYWEGPLEEAIGGLPVKPKLEVVQLPAPVTPEDRDRAQALEALGGRTPIKATLDGTVPELEWWVEGVVPRGRLVSIVAEAKVGKSLFVLDFACSLATGRPFFRENYGPIKVLYLDYEMTRVDFHSRLVDLGYDEDEATKQLLEDHLDYLQFPLLDPLDTDTGGRGLRYVVEEGKHDLIIVDTLAAAVEGPENESDTYRAARQYTWTPLKAMGKTVVRIDHLGKDKSRGARGSSMKRDDVDLVWELSRLSGNGADRLLLKNTYSRLAITETKFEVNRLTAPLRHVLTGQRVWTTDAVSLARAMTKAGIALDGPGKLADRVRRAGIAFDQRKLADARAYIEAGMPALGPDMASPVTDPRAAESQLPPAAPPARDFTEPTRRPKLRGIDSLEVT